MSEDSTTPQQKDEGGPKCTVAQILEDMPWRDPTASSTGEYAVLFRNGFYSGCGA